MNIIAPLLLLYALVAFTATNGNPIWVSPAQVATVTKALPYDCNGPGSKINFSSSYVCVQEEPEAVVEKLSK